MMKLARDLSVLSIHRSALARALPVAVLAFAGGAGLAFLPGQLRAQEMTSREVVQPLPSGEVQRLNRALMRLARDPRDLAALLEAGEAALKVDDFEAASGFFARAVTVAPDHPRGRLGLARVYLKSGEAPQALDQFARAIDAGAAENELLLDRALAYDLVGDQGKAQTGYLRALELTPGDAEARRRLAVSFAISGNRAGFEDTLRPLLDQRDVAALRTRAFGLAIIGDQDRAALIVEQAMPRDLSSRLIPYLAFMPRLTRPQQAAAANLGIFPRAADIGRDDPRLARFAEEAKADSRLEPTGAPLGGTTAVGSSADRAGSRRRANVPSQPGVVAASSRRERRAAARNAPAPQPTDGTGAAAVDPVPSPPPTVVAVAVAAPVQPATAPAALSTGPEIAAAPSATAAPFAPPPAPCTPAFTCTFAACSFSAVARGRCLCRSG
jgi:Flp pilus assembly protein TadD